MRVWIERPPRIEGDPQAQAEALVRWAERVTEVLNLMSATPR